MHEFSGNGMKHPLLQTLRPRQWAKNLVVFAGVFFSEKRLLFEKNAWIYAGIGFLIFCGLSGSVYILNDLVDLEKDRQHPEKRHRPIASRTLSVRNAKVFFLLILLTSLVAAFQLPQLFFWSGLSYFLINIAYSFWLKHVVILDVLTISIGFVLRAQAGVGAIKAVDPSIYISHWLLVCTLMLALFLALAKRRQEIFHLQQEASDYRQILSEYSLPFIDDLISCVSAGAIMGYSIYTISPETIKKFGTDKLVYTIPFVVYGIFRYQYLIHIKNLGDKPTEILLSDRPLQLNLLLWISLVGLILHFH